MLSRRGFIFGAGATLAVIRTPGLLMSIRSYPPPDRLLQWTFVEVPEILGLNVMGKIIDFVPSFTNIGAVTVNRVPVLRDGKPFIAGDLHA